MKVQQHSVEQLIDLNLIEHKRSIDQIVERFKNTVIVRALVLTDGNMSKAAELLQTHRNNVYRWIEEYELHIEEWEKV